MADLQKSAVTLNETWRTGHNNQFLVRDVTVVLTGQGGATNKITATALGFSKIRDVSTPVKADNTAIAMAYPSFDRTFVVLDSDITGPQDVSGTYRLTVTGK